MSPLDSLSNADRPSSVKFTLYACMSMITAIASHTERTANSPLPLDNFVNFPLNFPLWQRREPKPRTSRLNRRRDFIDVVTKNTKANIFGVCLDD